MTLSTNSQQSKLMKPKNTKAKKAPKEIIVKENGDVMIITPAEFRAPTIRDNALALRSLGKRGIPLHDAADLLEMRDAATVNSVVLDHATLALDLLEAIHRGDAAPLRAIADAMKAADKEKATTTHHKRDPITNAVIMAARKANGIPTEEQFGDALLEITETGSGFAPKGGIYCRSDKRHDALNTHGFQLEKKIKRGDTLRKSPK